MLRRAFEFLKMPLFALSLFAVLSVSAPAQAENQTENEYYLPSGKAEAGREAFIRYRCHACHTRGAETFPPVDRSVEGPNLALNLSGKESGQIATSILAPSHTIAYGYGEGTPEDTQKSPMPDFTSQMTVRELVDIVSYLRS